MWKSSGENETGSLTKKDWQRSSHSSLLHVSSHSVWCRAMLPRYIVSQLRVIFSPFFPARLNDFISYPPPPHHLPMCHFFYVCPSLSNAHFCLKGPFFFFPVFLCRLHRFPSVSPLKSSCLALSVFVKCIFLFTESRLSLNQFIQLFPSQILSRLIKHDEPPP